MITTTVTSNSDMDLVAESLSGDRDAFGHIVSRYQNLICSLAYSATGNLSQSEDLAQETFLAAWKQLGDLREPAKLRAWLCGIARNLINNTLRRQGREPVHHAETLETVHETATADRAPGEHAITNEEQAIMWRALERIPDIYREPLVLFYREHQSIEAVAQSLELSEDAVKQRLSRGRKLLQEEVAAFVEGALRQSAPSQAFAGAVLSALPMKPLVAASATAGAGAAKGGGLLSILALPMLGFFGSLFGSIWFAVKSKDLPHGARMRRGLLLIWLSVVWMVGGQNGVAYLHGHLGWSEPQYALAQAGVSWVFAFLLLTWQTIFFTVRKPAASMNAWNENSQRSLPQQRGKLFPGVFGLAAWLGMVIGAFAWMVNLALGAGDSLAVGIIFVAGFLAVLSPVVVTSIIGEGGMRASRWSNMPAILIYGTILLMVNWRLDRWIAAGVGDVHNGLDMTAAHQIMPMWIVHVGTLALLIWVGILLAVTKPKQAN